MPSTLLFPPTAPDVSSLDDALFAAPYYSKGRISALLSIGELTLRPSCSPAIICGPLPQLMAISIFTSNKASKVRSGQICMPGKRGAPHQIIGARIEPVKRARGG